MALIALLGACAGPAPAGPVALIDAASWVPSPAPDPFVDHRPADASCDGGTSVEGATLEIDTGACTWLWVEQPLLDEVAAGDRLEFVFWHGWLDAPEPAEAHLALAFEGEPAWDVTVPVPGEPDAYTIELDAPSAVPAGAPVGLHLHNHGANTWNVLRLDRLPRDE
jgi:hypothetical protein